MYIKYNIQGLFSGIWDFCTVIQNLHLMEENDTLKLLSTTTEIRQKLDDMHKDLLAVKKQHNMIDGDPILDFYDTCRMLHLSERQVRRLREEKKLTGFLLGAKRMYRYSEIKRYIDTLERNARGQRSKQLTENIQDKR